MRVRVNLSAGLLLTTIVSAATAAPQFGRVVAFGDSYADSGNARAFFVDRGLGRLSSSTIYPTGRFSGGTNFVDTIAKDYDATEVNYAVGGAKADAGNVAANGMLSGFRQQWQGFTRGGAIYASGQATVIPSGGAQFSPDDLVLLSVGGNDARGYRISAGANNVGAIAAANHSAMAASAGLDALVSRGLKHLVWVSGDVGQLPEVMGNKQGASIGTAFSTTYNAQMQGALAGVARNGVQVAYVDITSVAMTIRNRPGLFGITNTTAPCPISCVGNSAQQAKYLFYVDGLHMTSAGFAAVARYAENQLAAPYAMRAIGDAPRLAAEQFGQSLNNRADLQRNGNRRRGVSVFGNFTAGHQTFHETGDSNGYADNQHGGIGGAEYGAKFGTVGAAFAYTDSRVNGDNADRTLARTYQFGAYGTYERHAFFAQGYAGYGWHHLDMRRTGVAAPLTATPNAQSVITGGRVGYLPSLALVKLGPVAGLDYAFSSLSGYRETGDEAAALNMGSQKSETLIGSAGLEMRGQIFSHFVPWLRATARKDFMSGGRTLSYAPVVAPGIVNNFALAGQSHRVYGAVEGGLSAELMHGFAVQFSGRTTFGRENGNNTTGLVGVQLVF